MRRVLLVPLLLVPVMVVALVVIALLLVCRGGTDLTDREISDAELASMVLYKGELGLGWAYADFELGEDSGFVSNKEEIEDAPDQEDEADDVQRFGRVKGYEESYSSLKALWEGEGVVSVMTEVELYEDADGASGDFNDGIKDMQDSVGTTHEESTLEKMEVFDVEAVGDESSGVTMTVGISNGQGSTMYATLVGFRRGRLIGSVGIARLDNEDVRDDAEELARALDDRIVAILRGDIEPKETPTPRPAATPTPTPAAWAPSSLLESFRFRSEKAMEPDGGLTTLAEGEFEAPDRLSCTTTYYLGSLALMRVELIAIGDDAWIDYGEGYLATTTTGNPMVVASLQFCPGSPLFWQDLDFARDHIPLQGVPETKNGVPALRYPVGEALDALGPSGLLPPELAGLTVGVFDLWLAEDGGWPVSMTAEWTAEGVGVPSAGEASQKARMRMQVDITDSNSPDIRVDPPNG